MVPIIKYDSCSTATELMQKLSPVAATWGDSPGDWIFRGLADTKRYQLIPSALRLPPPILSFTDKAPAAPATRLTLKHIDQVDLEYGLLWEFFRVADGQGLLIPEDSQIYRSPWGHMDIEKDLERAKQGKGRWPFDALLSLAALAQHYGVPTRLLDWSNDAFIAAYFAASEAGIRLDRWNQGQCSMCGAERSGSAQCSRCDILLTDAHPDQLRLGVWCLNWRYVLNRWPGGTEAEQIEVLLVMAPRATNPNLHAQGGVFTVHLIKPGKPTAKINRETLDSVILGTAKKVKGTRRPYMRLLTLPVKEADTLLRLLAMQNIHAASIYPGFDGVVRHLNEWRLWDIPPHPQDLPIR
jgi:hypothetical protein